MRRRPRPMNQDFEEYAPKRKVTGQRPVDYFSSTIHLVKNRIFHHNSPHSYHVPPDGYYTKDLLPARSTPFNPSTALCTQWVNTSFHPDARAGGPGRQTRVAMNCLEWSPTGRRLLCGTARGEFLLFNGNSFGLEVKTVAHEDGRGCRAIAWGKVNDLVLSGDEGGSMKMWLSNLRVYVSEFNSNHRSIREISWSPTEQKFCTSGQDGCVRIWDTNQAGSAVNGIVEEESRLEGHGGDVHTVDWHPFKALILTGSLDKDCKLWDPRTAYSGSVATLSGHAQPVTCAKWHRNGYQFITSSRDCTCKLWDIRHVKEVTSFQGHSKDAVKVRWHPTHPDVFASTSVDGSILFWTVAEGDGSRSRADSALEVLNYSAAIEAAHDKLKDVAIPVRDMQWSPLGHVMASCATELKYWHRNKPGTMDEKERGADLDELEALV